MSYNPDAPSFRLQEVHGFQEATSGLSLTKTRGLDVAADTIEQAFQKYQTEVPRDGGSVAPGKRKTAQNMRVSMTDIVTASSNNLVNWNARQR